MYEEIERPNKTEQKLAFESYGMLVAALGHVTTEEPEIEIEETGDRVKIPLRALKLLGNILKAMGKGEPISLVPVAMEVTTQKAAEYLGCSRPHLVKLLEDGQISYVKVGRHRRIKFEDLAQFRKQMKQTQRQHLVDMMGLDEEAGMYDS